MWNPYYKKTLIRYNGRLSDPSYVIPKGVTHIGDEAFKECENLTIMTIPKGVESIGKKAFANCKNLTSVTLPSSVTSIKESTVSGGENLLDITIQDGIEIIGDEAFCGCKNLKDIKMPCSVKSIGKRVFFGCEFDAGGQRHPWRGYGIWCRRADRKEPGGKRLRICWKSGQKTESNFV